MKIMLKCCLFVIDEVEDDSIKRRDKKALKVLTTKKNKEIIGVEFDEKSDFKTQLSDYICELIGTTKFHIEQVYTIGYNKFFQDNSIDVVYIGVANIADIKELKEGYEFTTFVPNSESNAIQYGKDTYNYKITKVASANQEDHLHEFGNIPLNMEKNLLAVLLVYKYIKSRLLTTTIVFSLLPELFTLEEARVIFELISERKIDRSNFRKKCSTFCKKVNIQIKDKGNRTANLFKFDKEHATVYYR